LGSAGLDKDQIKHDLDYERYAKLFDMGMLFCVTVRDDAKLVGYAIYFVITHMHYKSSGLMATTDMYYLLPEYRRGGIGAKMFIVAEKGLKALGVVRAHTSCKVHEDHSELLKALGWKHTDQTFSKFLGDK
jgi:GNAT superfamily N-acetyltransferase